MTISSKKALAVVRCGNSSLHTSWAGSEIDRTVDVGVSYFVGNENKAYTNACMPTGEQLGVDSSAQIAPLSNRAVSSTR